MKPFPVTDYLKDIDAEMLMHRQEIAKHQVRLQQLADMRVLMMTREEDRAAGMGLSSPFGTLPEGAEIAVRDPLTYRPAMALTASLEAKTIGRPRLSEDEKKERERVRKRLREHTPERRNYKAEYNRRKKAERLSRSEILAKYGQHGAPDEEGPAAPVNGHAGPHARRGQGIHRQFADPIKRLFLDRPSTPIMTKEVIDAMFPKEVPNKQQKQAIYQALYDLRRTGFLHQSHQGEPYTLVRSVGLGQAG